MTNTCFKELNPSDKANYRLVSILPLVSKVFENSSAYSKWSKIRRGIPQGSILGPLSSVFVLLMFIFINDVFAIIKQSDICDFADDNTLYSCGEKLTEIKKNLIFDIKNILNWFRLNSLEINPVKF